MTRRYFEDATVGERYDCGTYTVSAEEVVEIGERFDPQPYHVDEAVATERFGGLLASAIHTLGICQRCVTDTVFDQFVTDAGAGFGEIQCYGPVFAGDTLSIQAEILGKRRLESYPERGLVRVEYAAYNEEDELVFTAEALPFFSVRDADGPDPER